MNRVGLALLIVGLTACGASGNKVGDGEAKNRANNVNNANNTNNANNANSNNANNINNTLQLADKCTAGTSYQNGVSLFADKSADWGLPTINPEGVRMSAVDFDGDGFLDIFVRRTGSTPDDFGPDGHRSTWLLRNTGSGFEDVTESSGIVASRFVEGNRPADVTVWGDVDNDGDMDAFSGFTHDGSVLDAATIMLNNGDGTFGRYTGALEFEVRAQPATVGGASFVDANRDGRLDLWVGRGTLDGVAQPDQLYIQQPNGDFVDQSSDFGIVSQPWQNPEDLNAARAHTNSWGTTACDVTQDGVPELLSASYGRAPNHLWASNETGFENKSLESGYAFDGNQDWTASHAARCYCASNPNDEGCNLAPAPIYQCPSPRGWVHARDTQPFRLGGNSGTTVCADLNNDGLLDLFTTEIVHFDVGANSDASEVLLNDGTGVFQRPGNDVLGITKVREGAGWDDGDITAAVFDFDNDGRNDIMLGSTDYPGTRAWLYWQQEDGTYRRLTTQEGINHTSSHGVVTGDFDRDGDVDFIAGHSAFRCSSGSHCYPGGERHVRFFENTNAQDGNWIQIELEGGEGTNRAAIGAQVTVEADDLIQIQEVGGGHGHYGLQNDRVLHFGLGTNCTAEVTIRWPDASGTTQTLELQTGYRYKLTQAGELTVVN